MMRIYVACLASYNNGVLHGAWIDCEDRTAAEMQGDVDAMLRASPFPNVTVEHPDTGEQVPSAEEWAIHDHDGFDELIGEFGSLDEVETIAAAIAGDYEIGFRWLVGDHGMAPGEAAARASDVNLWDGDHGQGRERILGDYAQDLADEAGSLSTIPEPYRNYIDWDSIGRDMELNGDIATFEIDHTVYIIANPREF